MKYDFKCEDCHGIVFETDTRFPTQCPQGHSQTGLRRIFNPPAVHREMAAQFAPSVGRYITNKHDHSEALKQLSHEASESTGMEHRYVPIDMADRDATGRTEE